MSFKPNVSLLIFCLNDVSIDVSGVLKSPTVSLLLLISLLRPVNICFMYCGAPILGAYVFFRCYIFLLH